MFASERPVKTRRPATAAPSPLLLLGDHAGRRIPAALHGLGLDAGDRVRHIAWDIGVAALGARLSDALGATFIAQRVSRLVIDCNRHPQADDAIPAVSDGSVIHGNVDLTAAQRDERIAAFHAPYHAAIAAEIAQRAAAGTPTVVVALHSFTPVLNTAARPWHAGVLHDGANDAYARRVLARLRAVAGLVVGDNAPYRMDAVDYTVPRHAFGAGLPYVEIEIRQDLLGTPEHIAQVARWLGPALLAALAPR